MCCVCQKIHAYANTIGEVSVDAEVYIKVHKFHMLGAETYFVYSVEQDRFVAIDEQVSKKFS